MTIESVERFVGKKDLGNFSIHGSLNFEMDMRRAHVASCRSVRPGLDAGNGVSAIAIGSQSGIAVEVWI
jgi:hypothetical protein